MLAQLPADQTDPASSNPASPDVSRPPGTSQPRADQAGPLQEAAGRTLPAGPGTIPGMTRDELAARCATYGWPGFRVDQVLRWVYRQRARDFAAMTNLPADLRRHLAQRHAIRRAVVVERLGASDGTIKLLLRWPDGALTETVFLPAASTRRKASTGPSRHTVCISTQVGCPVCCAFCASGADGLQRSLTAAEIVEQVLWAQDQLPPDERLTNVVVMGMGEPLANYENMLRALRIINAAWACGIGARHITVSTIGLPEQIRRLAREPLQVTLALSLHAADNDLRRQLIPWARRISLEQLRAALQDYYRLTHREVTLEYILLRGVNCSPQHADQLARWARSLRCNVNLINYNPVAGGRYQPVDADMARAFAEQLRRRGLNVHLRHSRGGQIAAACGQLRRRHGRGGSPAAGATVDKPPDSP